MVTRLPPTLPIKPMKYVLSTRLRHRHPWGNGPTPGLLLEKKIFGEQAPM